MLKEGKDNAKYYFGQNRPTLIVGGLVNFITRCLLAEVGVQNIRNTVLFLGLIQNTALVLGYLLCKGF